MSKKISSTHQADFNELYKMIVQAKTKIFHKINQSLIKLYWSVGQFVSQKVDNAGWGKSVVEELAHYLSSKAPNSKGFSARNIWRMKQFFEMYQAHENLSAILTEITWTNHLHIMSKTKSLEEKEFYLKLAMKQHYSERDFARIIDSGTYERTIIANKKLSAALTEFPKPTENLFKDIYLFDFIEISENHHEFELRKGLINHLSKFLMEMGPDFSVMGEEYIVQVGNKDFRIDLLMHHRSLNCLVAIELKSTEFKPAHLGQLQFYLEALDRDVKKPHENPSIGILICKTKDDEIVKYAMNRHLSPTMIAEYETKLINKTLLQKKIHELTEILQFDDDISNNVLNEEVI